MSQAKAYAANSETSPFAPLTIERREPTARDVEIDILFCGICHSDMHTVRNDWKEFMPTVYPCVPGHEIVGKVTAVGADVTDFAVGDTVGVGCLVDSDGTCPSCASDLEQFCPQGVFTYNAPDKHGTTPVTYGGYSERVVVDQHFVLRIPEGLELSATAPLLCAGITTYSPLKRAGVGPGKKVGIVSLKSRRNNRPFPPISPLHAMQVARRSLPVTRLEVREDSAPPHAGRQQAHSPTHRSRTSRAPL